MLLNTDSALASASDESPIFPEEPTSSFSDPDWIIDAALGDVNMDGLLDIVCVRSTGYNSLYLGTTNGFSESPVWSSHQIDSTWCIALGDVDGDGDLDLACGSIGDYQGDGHPNTLYLNHSGVFSAEPDWSTESAYRTWQVVLADLDQDYDLDLLCANSGKPNTMYLNEGGKYPSLPSWESAASESTISIALGDIDNDGDLDLVCGNWRDENTAYLNNDGSLATEPFWHSLEALPTMSVALGDVDSDGDLDLVSGGFSGVRLYVNSGSTFAASASWVVAEEDTVVSVALGDLDNDGDLDVVCGAGYLKGERDKAYLNQGGTFSAMPDWEAGPSLQTWDTALGDTDNDGDLDLWCWILGGAVQFENMTPPLGSSPDWTGDLPELTSAIALGDIDADGFADLVCGNAGLEWESPQKNSIYLGSPDGFSSSPDWMSDKFGFTYDVELADLNADQIEDMLFIYGDSIFVLYPEEPGVIPSRSLWAFVDTDSNFDASLLDVDLDGDLDLAVGDPGGPNRLYSSNAGLFSRGPSWVSDVRDTTIASVAGDIDGDGYPDLLFVSTSYDVRQTTRSTYYSAGGAYGGTPDHQISSNMNTWTVALGDVDGDHDLDLVCGTAGQNNALFLNDSGSLADRPVWHSWPAEVTARVALADVDGDGSLDLLCANAGKDSISGEPNSLYLNGDTGFQIVPPWKSQAANVSMDVEATDLDLDGDCDVVFANMGQGNTLYFGLGNPPFKGDPTAPTNHLSNNSAFLRYARVEQPEDGVVRVHFTAIDVESDPVYVLPEYQYRGAPVWYPVEADGATGKIGLLATSPEGVEHSFDWNVAILPFDRREVVLRLRTIEVPRRVSEIRQIPTYLLDIPPKYVLPAVAAAPQADAGGAHLSGDEIPVVITRQQAMTIASGYLFYRSGGETEYKAASIDVSQNPPRATIPASAVGPRGVEYYVDVTSSTRNLTFPPVDPEGHPASILITVGNLTEEQDQLGEKYRMVSVPLAFPADSCVTLEAILSDQSAFGSYDRTRWRAFRYDGASGGYAELSPGESSEDHCLAPSKAFWLIARERARIGTAPVTGVSVPTNTRYSIPLTPGWNMIADPFAFAVEWDSITVNGVSMDEQDAVEPPYFWDYEQSSYEESVSVLQPFEGYFVRNWADTAVTLEVLPREAVSASGKEEVTAGKQPAVAGAWSLRITASCGDVRDAANRIGVEEGASLAWDRHDRSEPPPSPGDHLSLYFPHTSWAKRAGYYSADLRGAYAAVGKTAFSKALGAGDLGGHTWAFDVAKSFAKSGVGDEVRLDFTGLHALPPGARILLLDRELQTIVNIGQEPSYTFHLGKRDRIADDEDARFLLLVGSEEFLDENGAELPQPPLHTSLHPNIPNPFNPSTIIRYDLAEAGPVELSIYDIRGGLVNVLESSVKEPGRYEALWNGENSAGRPAASGIYFCRLRTERQTDIQKMLLIR